MKTGVLSSPKTILVNMYIAKIGWDRAKRMHVFCMSLYCTDLPVITAFIDQTIVLVANFSISARIKYFVIRFDNRQKMLGILFIISHFKFDCFFHRDSFMFAGLFDN